MGYHTEFNGKFGITLPNLQITNEQKQLTANTPIVITGNEIVKNSRTILDDLNPLQTLAYVTLLSRSRRMKRNVSDYYGVDGEFYVNLSDIGNVGQTVTADVVDQNTPPSTQPSLWMDMEVEYDERTQELSLCFLDGKNYEFEKWLDYLVKNFFEPKGIMLNGEIKWRGEEWDDTGSIIMEDNKISILQD